MENKKRLINAKDFDLRVAKKSMTEVFPNWKELPKEVQDAVCKHAQHLHMLLETQPTIDAEPVTRCRHCIHWREPWLVDQTMGKCMLGKTEITKPDHFCSRGERIE